MKNHISEIIQKLQEIQKERGDLLVFVLDSELGYCELKSHEIEIISANKVNEILPFYENEWVVVVVV